MRACLIQWSEKHRLENLPLAHDWTARLHFYTSKIHLPLKRKQRSGESARKWRFFTNPLAFQKSLCHTELSPSRCFPAVCQLVPLVPPRNPQVVCFPLCWFAHCEWANRKSSTLRYPALLCRVFGCPWDPVGHPGFSRGRTPAVSLPSIHSAQSYWVPPFARRCASQEAMSGPAEWIW